MCMKHYAPNRCEPSIEALNFTEERSGWGGGVRVDVNEELKFLRKLKKINIFLGGGGSGRGGRVGGSG